MKKIRLFTLLSLILSLTLLLLVGCEKEDKISSVYLKDHDPASVIETDAGAFDYSAYTLVVSYESGNTTELKLTEDMISDGDIFKFYKEGEHDITILYGEHSCVFKIAVRRSSFDTLKFSENNVFTYDGKPHSAEIIGDLPANAVITYQGGNSFVNAGVYNVTAIISCEGYVTTKLTTTVTIERAKYDMSGVKFEPVEVVYDGKAHSVEISGTLPEGLSGPIYTIGEKVTSSAIDVGEYKVRATFTNNNSNYESVPFMETTLKITPSVYTLPGVDLVFKNSDGSVINASSKVYDGKGVSYEINDKSIVGTKIFVSYTVLDENGTPITDSRGSAVTSFKDAGVYTVRMNVVLVDGKNYQSIEPIERAFEIKKAQYDSTKIYFESGLAVFDGNAHKISVTLPADHDIKPEDIVYEYYVGDKLVNVDPKIGVINAGVYTVKAIFPDKNSNYKKIADMQAVLRIETQQIDVSHVGFFGDTKVEYNAKEVVPGFRTFKQASGLDYELFTYSDREYYKLNDSGEYVKIDGAPSGVGVYRCALIAKMIDEHVANYTTSIGSYTLDLEFNFEIYKKEIEVPYVSFLTNSQTDYNGRAQGNDYTCNADAEFVSIITTYYSYRTDKYQLMGEGELPTEAGFYRVVVTLRIKDAKNCIFTNGQISVEYAHAFEIVPKAISASGVGVNKIEFTYNGSSQAPALTGLPENLTADITIYPQGSSAPIAEAIDAGYYRLEAILAPKNGNYMLSTSSKLVFNFEIDPKVIDLDGFEFDSLEFEYDGNEHSPSLVGLPLDEVEIYSRTVYYTTLNMLYGDMEVANAIGAGDYRYTFSIRAKNSNYAIEGQSSHSVNFKIRSKELANLDSMITGNYELVWVEGGYTSKTLQNAINKALFGNMSYEVAVTLNSVYSVDEGKDVSVAEIKAGGIYKIYCKLEMWGQEDSYHSGIKYYNYKFTHNGLSKSSVMNIEFNFTVVNLT